MSIKHPKKVVVLHSGGLDSTVCLQLAISRGYEVVSLGVNYNQHHQIELNYAAKQCALRGIERKVISVAWDKPLRALPTNRTVDQIRSGVSSAFLPGRNGIFLMLAAAEAAGVGAKEVWTGINSVDFSGYPDCRAEFVESFQQMLAFAIPKGPRMVAPLQNKSKPQIARMAKKLGIGKTDTWSCYRPAITQSGLSPCGACDACKLHEFAWHGLA
jgi:7-cyano-7-deazaguanine synthase